MTELGEREGQCYRLAGRYVMDNRDAVLVHTTLFSPTLGHRMSHAFVEITPDMVWEPVTDQVFLKGTLFPKYEVEEDARYTADEMSRLLVTNNHWGPWEKEGDNEGS
ncbi:hypothetical protein LCGC14_1537360 [marine sediment metagenome]|uniref:Uncharacterized protein n=1 Tax=marine sediment metagenome TaxID=412755 RepID=A0A0F9IU64_9ZZZZ